MTDFLDHVWLKGGIVYVQARIAQLKQSVLIGIRLRDNRIVDSGPLIGVGSTVYNLALVAS